MKKTTFILLSILIFSFHSHAQYVDWVNEYGFNDPVNIGQTISLEIDYDAITGNDVDWIRVYLARLDTSTSPFWTSLEEYNTGIQEPISENDANSGMGIMVDYTIPSDVPLSSSLPSNEVIMLMVVMQYEIGGEGSGNTAEASNNIVVNVQAALSLENNSFENIKIYPNPVSTKLNIKNIVQAKSYQIRSISGQLLLEETFNNEINVEGLSPGVYFLGIDNKYSKFIKN